MSSIHSNREIVSCSSAPAPLSVAVARKGRRPVGPLATVDGLDPAQVAPPTRVDSRMPLADADLMWCRLPGPAPLPTGVLSFSGRVPKEVAVAFLRDRLFAVPDFAKRLVADPDGTPVWQRERDIDVVRHLQHHVLDCDSRNPRFFEALATWCQAPLRPNQLPWDMTLVDCSDRSVIFVRVHHAVTDGPGMMRALLCCHDDPQAWPRAEKAAQALMARHRRVAYRPHPDAALLQQVLSAAWAWLMLAMHGLEFAAKCLEAAARIATRRPDRRTPIMPVHTVAEFRYAQVPHAWSMDTIKKLAASLRGGTVNDVLLTVFTGALRETLAALGEPVDRITVRAMQTVNLPRKSGTHGNNVGLAMADLPIDAATPLGRYQRMRATMRRFKRSAEPLVASTAMAWVARMPQVVIDFMHRRTTAQCSALVSNVHGPAEPFVIAGHVAEGLCWFAPRFGSVGVQFPVISYNNAVQVTVEVDAALGFTAQDLAATVQRHFEDLVEAASRA